MGVLRDQLQKFWGSPNQRILVVGMGRRIRGDESIGLIVADELQALSISRSMIIIAEDRPENYTEEIRHFSPTRILFILANELGSAPWETRLVRIEEHEGIGLHESPLMTLTHFLSIFIQAEVRLLLIEPKRGMGEESSEIAVEAKKITAEIAGSMQP